MFTCQNVVSVRKLLEVTQNGCFCLNYIHNGDLNIASAQYKITYKLPDVQSS